MSTFASFKSRYARFNAISESRSVTLAKRCPVGSAIWSVVHQVVIGNTDNRQHFTGVGLYDVHTIN